MHRIHFAAAAGLFLFIFSGCGSSQAEPVKTISADSASFDVNADPPPPAAPQPAGNWKLALLGRFQHGSAGVSAAEIVAFEPVSKRAFVVNAHSASIDVLDLADPSAPQLARSVSLSKHGKPTSVAVSGGKVAAVVAPKSKRERGHVVFLSPEGEILSELPVGHEPDMVVFTPDGRTLLTANEGEPEDDYSFDPEGSISLIDVSGGITGLNESHVVTLTFEKFNATRSTLDSSIRIYGTNATVAQDLEPEYIAVAADSRTAWVTCQENNAVAVVDLEKREIVQLKGLGYKDHSRAGAAIDASDKDKKIRIGPWPVLGMYQPDGIAAFSAGDETFLLTCNEGEAREYRGCNEQLRVAELKLDARVFGNASELQKSKNLGRLRTTRLMGDHNGDGLHEEIFCYGGRSFSILNSRLERVYDSGDAFERITADRHPRGFNASNDNDGFDDRSDNKGPEPEGVVVGAVNGRTLAFIGLERISGIMVYDVTDPASPVFESYYNTRDFIGDMSSGKADVGPEGLTFVSEANSPIGKPLLIVAYEISGTTCVYRIERSESASSAETSPAEAQPKP